MELGLSMAGKMTGNNDPFFNDPVFSSPLFNGPFFPREGRA